MRYNFDGFDGHREVAVQFLVEGERNQPRGWPQDVVEVNAMNMVVAHSGPGCIVVYDTGKFKDGATFKDVYRDVQRIEFTNEVWGIMHGTVLNLYQIVKVYVTKGD